MTYSQKEKGISSEVPTGALAICFAFGLERRGVEDEY